MTIAYALEALGDMKLELYTAENKIRQTIADALGIEFRAVHVKSQAIVIKFSNSKIHQPKYKHWTDGNNSKIVAE